MLSHETFRAQLVELYGAGSDAELSRKGAADLGVHQRTVYRWLRGETPLPWIAVKCVDLLHQLDHYRALLPRHRPDKPDRDPS